MKLMWLGQNGLLFDFDGIKIMIDPYLTDSLAKKDKVFSRKIKTNKKLFKAKPDAIILTNCHLDHSDNDSLIKLNKSMGKKRALILSCESVYDDITTIPSLASANHIMFEKNSEWTIGNINIRAVPAKSDDKTSFGVILTNFSDNKKYYIAGDTLYSSYVIDSLGEDIYASFIPINGEYGSMNVIDAKRFALKIKSRFVVPVHFGMFDKVDPSLFDVENAIIPKPYKIINFDECELTVPNSYKTEEVHTENNTQSQSESDKNNVTGVNENGKSDVGEDETVKSEVVSEGEVVTEGDETVKDDVVDEGEVVTEGDETLKDEVVSEGEVVTEGDETVKDEVVSDGEVVTEGDETDEDEVVDEGEILTEGDETLKDEVVDEGEVVTEDDETNEDEVVGEDFEVIEDFVLEDFTSNNVDDFIDDNEDEDEDNDDDANNEDNADNEDNDDGDGEIVFQKEMSDSEKIDAVIREIEKYERGETADFSAIK